MTLAWDNTFLQEYESYWCTIEKVKYSNSITGKELLKLIRCKGDNVPLYFKHFLLNQKELLEQLELDLEDKHKKWLANLLGTLADEDEAIKYFYPYLKYCPLCIKQGYHSFIHQLNFIHYCPIHNIPLKNSCPCCNKPIVIDIRYTGNLKAFTCTCNYTLIDEMSPKKTLKMWKLLKEYQDIYTTFNTKLPNHLWRLYFYIEYTQNVFIPSDNHASILINYILSNNLNGHCVVTEIDTRNIKKTMPTFENEFYRYLAQLYMNSYKAIAKQIRRRHKEINRYINWIKKNKLGILYEVKSNRSRNMKYSAICYAYTMWMKDIEGISKLDYLHSKDYPISRISAALLESKLFTYLINEVNLYLKSSSKPNLIQYLIGLEHIITKMMYKHYKNWLEYALEKGNLQGNSPFDWFKKIEYKLPMFLIGFHDTNRLKIYEFNTT